MRKQKRPSLLDGPSPNINSLLSLNRAVLGSDYGLVAAEEVAPKHWNGERMGMAALKQFR